MPCGIAALKAKLGALESAIVEKFGAHGVLIIQYSDLNRSNSERRKAAQVRRCPMKSLGHALGAFDGSRAVTGGLASRCSNLTCSSARAR
jgi:hypothetical protein